MMRGRWWSNWMRSLRWDENPSKSYPKQYIDRVPDITQAPQCRCGRPMRPCAGYSMGGASDWIAYACEAERPWNYWNHTPWTTLRKQLPV